MNILIGIIVALLVAVGVPSCTAVSMQKALVSRDEAVSGAEARMLSAYKKRADLMTNTIAIAEHALGAESKTLKEIVQARAAATSAQVSIPANATQADMDKFSASQAQLSGAFGRLLAITENYPTLQSVPQFANAQKELSGVESQCAAARSQYIKEVAAYNVNVRSFPNSLVAGFLGFRTKPQLQFAEDSKQLQTAPKLFK